MVNKGILELLIILMVYCISGCNNTTDVDINNTSLKEITQNEVNQDELLQDLNKEDTNEVKENNNLNTIKIEVNNKELIVELEDNQATKELVEKLNSKNVVVEAKEYGGFEKVGSLGFSLTKDDKQIKTEAGDVVLYQENQISLFYNSNSWSYTKLGKVINMSAEELKEVLGSNDVTMTLKI